jgi:hypothetical protein
LRWAIVLLAGCDDHLFPALAGSSGSDWCGILDESCVSCHSAAGKAGGLDLETDAHAALVDVASSAGPVLVVPGDPDASFLMAKLEGELAAGQGGPMPPSGPLPAEQIELIRQWIADGATAECDSTGGGPNQGVHPPEWPEPLEHGTAAKLGELRCATSGCHGEELQGDVGPPCASCHDLVVQDWTTSCTFCHGDRASDQPAPPQDIDDTSPDDISFSAHLAHVEPTALHAAPFGCTTCHIEPASIFSPGHLQFGGDLTFGVAEVTFGGLASGGSYDEGTCGVYCHSPGPDDDLVSVDDEVECGSCHGVLSRDGSWDSMSGKHEDHLEEDDEGTIICSDCHPSVNDAGTEVDPVEHVNGSVRVDPATVTYANGQCTGACHGEGHNNRAWIGGDDDDDD